MMQQHNESIDHRLEQMRISAISRTENQQLDIMLKDRSIYQRLKIQNEYYGLPTSMLVNFSFKNSSYVLKIANNEIVVHPLSLIWLDRIKKYCEHFRSFFAYYNLKSNLQYAESDRLYSSIPDSLFSIGEVFFNLDPKTIKIRSILSVYEDPHSWSILSRFDIQSNCVDILEHITHPRLRFDRLSLYNFMYDRFIKYFSNLETQIRIIVLNAKHIARSSTTPAMLVRGLQPSYEDCNAHKNMSE